jgi:hypothetical protein
MIFMGTIYKAPKELKIPEFCSPWEKYEKKCNSFVKAWAKANGNGPEAGLEVSFQARYVVVSLKPVKLIHLAVGDAWEYPYVHRLTAKDIRDNLKSRKSLDRLFKKAS